MYTRRVQESSEGRRDDDDEKEDENEVSMVWYVRCGKSHPSVRRVSLYKQGLGAMVSTCLLYMLVARV